MRKWLFVTGVAVALIAIAVPRVRAETGADSVAALSLELGKSDFRTYCAACHGVSGNGDGTVAEFLTISAPDLTTLTKRNAGTFPRQRLSEVIDGRAEVKVHGPRDMPVWGEWFDYEAMSPDTDRDAREIIVRLRIEALISYVESIQQK